MYSVRVSEWLTVAVCYGGACFCARYILHKLFCVCDVESYCAVFVVCQSFERPSFLYQ